MKLYLSHASSYDYKAELYEPIKDALALEHEIFFPHGENTDGVKSKDIIPKCDLILAEVSFPSTGQGIELGWADANNIPIICFHRSGAQVSSSLQFISNTIFEYTSIEDMIVKLRLEIENDDPRTAIA